MGGVSVILPGLKDARGVPGTFDGPEKGVVFFANHGGQKFAAQPAVPVFAAERAAVTLYEVGNFRRNDTKKSAMLLGLKIQDGPQMQLARAGMSIVHGSETMAAKDNVELPYKCRQIARIDRSILDHGHGLGITGDVGKKP